MVKLHNISQSASPPPTLTERETGFNLSKTVCFTAWEQQVLALLGRHWYALVTLVTTRKKPGVCWQSGGDSSPVSAPGYPDTFSIHQVAVRDPRLTDGSEYFLPYYENEIPNTDLQLYLLSDELQAIPFQYSNELRLLGLEMVKDNGRSCLVLRPDKLEDPSVMTFAQNLFKTCDADYQQRLLLDVHDSRSANFTYFDRPDAIKEVQFCTMLQYY